MSDWMFDEAGVTRELAAVAAAIEDALLHARGALEASDPDGPSDSDREALVAASEAVSAARRYLREVEAETLTDAEAMLREVLVRCDRSAPGALPDLPLVAHS
jgi:hypothetical protein